jgi:N-acetylglutamate synthase-like GNAT family acetyltransferase
VFYGNGGAVMRQNADHIRRTAAEDIPAMYEIINDASSAYKGHIPDDCWHEPYMSMDELEKQITEGIEFYCYVDGDEIIGVMGIQKRGEVCLIRHAYVRTQKRKGGIGTKLLHYLYTLTDAPVLIGTWKAAVWAIDFYKKNGFTLVSESEKDALLARFWHVPPRQVESSVVLVDERWLSLHHENK